MKKKLSTAIILMAALLAAPLVQHFGNTDSVAEAQDTDEKTIILIGASTTTNLIKDWVPEFETKNPGVKIMLHGSNHGAGFKALLERRAHIAMTARKLNQQELDEARSQGVAVSEELLKDDAVAFVAHQAIQVEALSIPQLAKIFSGQYTNWREAGGADEEIRIVVTTSPGGAMATFLSQTVFKIPFTDKPHSKHFPDEIPRWVSALKGAIGYCRTSLAYEFGRQKKVRILAIKKDDSSPAIHLSEETIKNGSYPIMRSLGLCYDPKTVPQHAKEFVAFCQKKAQAPQSATGEK